MQRMSSGLKINSAKDDAAGTVISARMAVQLDGNLIAQKNVQNANALLSTVEGNVDVVLDNISRIRDLTLQAKNGTYSTEEKQAMQDEVAQRIAEINRVSDSAKYSQLELFGGDIATSGLTFQVGTNATANDVIEADKSLFGSIKFLDLVNAGSEEGDTSIANFQATTHDNAWFETAGNKISGNVGKVFYNTDEHKMYVGVSDAKGDISFEEYDKNLKFTKLEVAIDENTQAGTGDGKIEGLAVGNIYETKDGDKIVVTAVKGVDEATKTTFVKLEDYAGAEAGSYATDSAFDISAMDKDGYTNAVNALDAAIDNLTSRKSLVGSLGNRLDSALDTLTTQNTNLTSAKSIITDADIASEAASYTQNQILQQVSTSLLAQANQAPSIALSLL